MLLLIGRSQRSGKRPKRTARVAAITGTPAGVSGVSRSASPAPATAAARAFRDLMSGTISARNSAGKAASRPSTAGSPSPVAGRHAEGGAAEPADVQHHAGAQHPPPVEAAVLLGDGPALVHEQLRFEHAAQPRAGERVCRREAHRAIPRVQQNRCRHGGHEGATGTEHGDHCELRRAGEGGGAHHDRGCGVEARRLREHAEGGAEHHRRRQREQSPRAGGIGRGGSCLRGRGAHRPQDATGCMEKQSSHRISFSVWMFKANLIR